MKHKATVQMQLWAIIFILFMILLSGCASNNTTPAERAAWEADRQEKFILWHEACKGAGLRIATHFHGGDRPRRCSYKVDVCVPPRWQWDFYYLSEERIRKQPPSKPTWRVKGGNTYRCGAF